MRNVRILVLVAGDWQHVVHAGHNLTNAMQGIRPCNVMIERERVTERESERGRRQKVIWQT